MKHEKYKIHFFIFHFSWKSNGRKTHGPYWILRQLVFEGLTFVTPVSRHVITTFTYMKQLLSSDRPKHSAVLRDGTRVFQSARIKILMMHFLEFICVKMHDFCVNAIPGSDITLVQIGNRSAKNYKCTFPSYQL